MDNEYQTSSGTENPHGLDQINFNEVVTEVEKLLPQSQVALKIVLAVTLAAYHSNPVMLWMLLVGVPSSGKTDLVRLVKDAPNTYYLDNLTLNAFISGERPTEKEEVHDLLPQLDGKCWVIKDWTSIFALDEKMTKKILGDMVNVFDKEFTKFSTRRGTVSFKSSFSHLGCITPATLNKHTGYLNMVGPRFLFYIIPDLTTDQEEQSFDQIFNGFNRDQLEQAARKSVGQYIELLKLQSYPSKIQFNKKAQEYLKIAARLLANCRGIVLLQSFTFKSEEGNDTQYYEAVDKPQIEQPWRGVQQLMTLSKYLALVSGRDSVNSDDLQIVKDVVLSSMPADRSQALKAIKASNGEITAKQLSEKSERSTKTSRRLLDELVALKVLEKTRGSSNQANDYRINDQFWNFILLDSTDFLSNNDESIKTIFEDEIEPNTEALSDSEIDQISSYLP